MVSLVRLVEDALDLLDFYEYLYPVNYEEEKKAFFNHLEDSKAYNPQYRYKNPTAKELNTAAHLIQDIREELDDSLLSQRFVTGLKARKRIVEVIGSPAITEVSKDVYGVPDQETVEKAEELLDPAMATEEEKTIPAETLRQAYMVLFERLDMDYSCQLVDAEVIRNHPRRRSILLPKNGAYGVTQAKRVLIHESTHSVRTHNGVETNEAALVYGTKGYETAEEGLPTFNEKEVGVFSDTLPRITSRVIAIDAADESFSDLYWTMRDHGLSERLAFIRTYRVKRGLEDTAMPGGFIKDHIYFEGFSRLEDRPELADALYIGKTSFEDMDTLPDIADMTPAISRDQHLHAYQHAAELLPE